MRILITNIMLGGRTGTESYVRDLAFGLIRRGHSVCVYAPYCGETAAEIRGRGIPVVDDLHQLGVSPEIIHGHHTAETMSALLHFPGVPAVFVCHDWSSWHDAPPLLARVRQFIAVDEIRRDRLVLENGIPQSQVSIIPNFVDTRRFLPRAALPPHPRRALVFNNSASEDSYLALVRQACQSQGISVDVVGRGVGRVCHRPETILPEYDLVFAIGRCALEALASGAAVILCDAIGSGELVVSTDFERHRRNNFGARTLYAPVRPEDLRNEISKFDPTDAARVCALVRTHASMDGALDQLLACYNHAITAQAAAGPVDFIAEARAVAAFLRGRTVDWLKVMAQNAALAQESSVLKAQVNDLQLQLAVLSENHESLKSSRRFRFGTYLAKMCYFAGLQRLSSRPRPPLPAPPAIPKI